jgi:hypothetical protein
MDIDSPSSERRRGRSSEELRAKGRQIQQEWERLRNPDARPRAPSPGKVKATAMRSVLSENDIASRAFEIYCRRGYHDGHDVDGWLDAERELRGEANSDGSD